MPGISSAGSSCSDNLCWLTLLSWNSAQRQRTRMATLTVWLNLHCMAPWLSASVACREWLRGGWRRWVPGARGRGRGQECALVETGAWYWNTSRFHFAGRKAEAIGWNLCFGDMQLAAFSKPRNHRQSLSSCAVQASSFRREWGLCYLCLLQRQSTSHVRSKEQVECQGSIWPERRPRLCLLPTRHGEYQLVTNNSSRSALEWFSQKWTC